jgi:hypothetical protein
MKYQLKHLKLFVTTFILGFMVQFLGAQTTVAYYETGEEFTGKLPGWKNVKDFGAKGDGITDDSAAIIAGLAAMKSVQTNSWCVLYFPAGTYKIASTITNAGLRLAHNDFLGAQIIGEDPATTIIEWAGADGKPMLLWDAWYSKICRLTLDGKNKASQGILFQGGFGTYGEQSDLVLKNIRGTGIDFSSDNQGQAENTIIRCKFLNCDTGVLACNWNSLDEYVWYCLFEDCSSAINACIGQIQIVGNVFLRSKEYDINQGPYSTAIINNTSIGSKTFFQGNDGGGYLKGNKIYNSTDEVVAYNYDAFIDNTVFSKYSSGPVVTPSGLAIGNTFSTSSWPIKPESYERYYSSDGMHLNWAIDNNVNTSFHDWDAVTNPPYGCSCGPFELEYTCSEGTKKAVVKYSITSGSTASRDLKYWKLQGSNTWGSSWVDLDTQSDQGWTSRRQKRDYNITNTTEYSLYRIYALTPYEEYPGGIEIAEIELLDVSNKDITEEVGGFLGSRLQHWGNNYYPFDNKSVSSATIQVPQTVSLPAILKNYNRNIFTVQKATGDDATALQNAIDTAAASTNGGIVYLAKGNYRLKRSVIIPANKDIIITGDGASEHGTNIEWSGDANQTGLILQGPSHATIRDTRLSFRGSNSDVMLVDNADQIGGSVYCDQVIISGNTLSEGMSYGVFVDGVENSTVTLRNGSCGNTLLGGVVAKGGAVLSSGGTTDGQIDFLFGGLGNTPNNLFDVQNGGRLIAGGFRDETEMEGTYINLGYESSGSLSVFGMSWAVTPSLNIPIIKTNSFDGYLTFVANRMGNGYSEDVPGSIFTQITGDGSGTNVFFANSKIYSKYSTTASKVWKDNSSPTANATFLNNSDFTDITNKLENIITDSNYITRSVAQLRSHRTDAPSVLSAGKTNVKLVRVIMSGSANKRGLTIKATNQLNLPDNFKETNYSSHIKLYPTIASDQFKVDYTLLNNESVTFSIIDLSGRVITNKKLQNMVQGEHQQIFSTKSLPSGYYLLRFETKDLVETLRFIVK